jgi:hypothetical protein
MDETTTAGPGWTCHCGAFVAWEQSHSCNPNPFTPLGPSIPLWPAPQGWQCPNCGSAHAPSVLTCPVQARSGTQISVSVGSTDDASEKPA